jgi:anti-sigma factor RsiW
MTLRCQDVMERLVEGATGVIPPSDRVPVLEHLAACPRCRHEAAAFEDTVARLRTAGEFATPPGFWTEFMGTLDRRLAEERLPLLVRMRRALATPRYAWGTAVATLVTVLALSTAIWQGPQQTTETDPLASSARGLVTESMATTLPSLGEMIDVWRAGLSALPDPFANGAEYRP